MTPAIIEASRRVLKSCCALFDDDPNWDVRDLDGVTELAELVGFALPPPLNADDC